MAGINDYSNTAGSNTTINGIDIAEGCSPAGINNAIRQLMADIADMDDGVVPLQTPDINGGTIDGAVIGGTTPAAGTFTNLTATGTLTGLLGNVSEDSTPQLGGNLDLNSNNITGTGNINITGTVTADGLNVGTNEYLSFSDGDTLNSIRAVGNDGITYHRGYNGFNFTRTVDSVNLLDMTDTADVVFNNGSADVDFRVESNNNSSMLRVDGGLDVVTIGATPIQYYGTLQVGSSSADIIVGRHTRVLGTVGTSGGMAGNSYYDESSATSKYFANGYSHYLRLSANTGDIELFAYPSGTANTNLGTSKSIFHYDASDAEIVINQKSDDLDFRVESDTNTHALFVDGGQSRVGINTSSPTDTLQIVGTSTNLQYDSDGSVGPAHQLYLNSASPADDDIVGRIRFFGNDSGGNKTSYAEIKAFSQDVTDGSEDGILSFYTNENNTLKQRFRIRSRYTMIPAYDSETFTTSEGLQSLAIRSQGGGGIYVENDQHSGPTGVTINTITMGGTSRAMQFKATGSLVGSIEYNSSTTSYNTSSDYRLKENVVEMTGATDRLKQLSPKRFNFIVDADTTVDGFLAHEVSDIVPEAIRGTKDEVEVWKEGEELPEGVFVGDNKLDDEGNTIPVYQGIDHSKLVPLLTASLKEAINKIEQLEARISALET